MQHTTETSSAISIRVVIVSYNTKVVTLRCLQSLYDRWITHSPHTIRVSVVDNASQDETSAAIQANFPQVEIRVLSKNRGYAAANNICLRTTQETFVLLLNSDTYLQEHTQP
jgi:GT2 family glycosyltransferase